MTESVSFFGTLFLLGAAWWLERNRRRWVRRARAKGDRWGREIHERGKSEHLPNAVSAMGRSLVLRTDHASALALVDGLVDATRSCRRHEAGVWHIAFVGQDDLVVATAAAPTGTEVVLSSLRDGSGFPPAAAWTHFLNRLEKTATKQGIVVEEQTGATYESRPVPGGEDLLWVRV